MARWIASLTLAVFGSFPMFAAPADWLLHPEGYKAEIKENKAAGELVLSNGLVRRLFRTTPDLATVSLDNLITGECLVRAVGPEARVTLNGTAFAVGGLTGQPVKNYLKAEWLDNLKSVPGAYHFASWTEGAIEARFPWKKRSEWLARDLPWPPPGRHLVLTFKPPEPQGEKSPEAWPAVEVHYEIYDGIPLISKWLVVRNTTKAVVRVNSFVAEELRLCETESNVEASPSHERMNLFVETDYAFAAMDAANAAAFSVSLESDPDYPTQVHYNRKTPCLLRTKPPLGPEQDVAVGGSFETFRTFELVLDSSERERRGLAQRRMYRTIAPWTAENPLMFHVRNGDPETVRVAIKQASDVGFEMLILSFGSGFNFESRDPTYQAKYKMLAAEAKEKHLVLGGYSLLASRGAGTAKDNTQKQPVRYGVMPCLGAKWGIDYLQQLKNFSREAGLGVLEHDGSYPGDKCDCADHPGHHGLGDSQWVQWRAITDFYKWCRAEGVYLNIPDWYFLSGGNKCGMGYRETNWSLPRAEQELIERQNIYDGTWTKTSSMGWMFVPLTAYHGGGVAATIEPLNKHLDHYETRLASLLGSGTQACYRGPRLYDTDDTKALVKKWVDFYKAHREVLDGDLIHIRRANGRDWDGWLNVNPLGREKGLAFFYNPLSEAIEREIRVPLYYTGLSESAMMSLEGAAPTKIALDRSETATIKVKIPAKGRVWLLFTAAK
ncbi:hypothetical protein BH11PLA2_BH11PLA2_41670 [soil metagenome]